MKTPSMTQVGVLLLLLISLAFLSSSIRASAADDLPATLQIAYQKYGTLPILKERGDLDRRLAALGVKVEWVQFQFGPPILEALNVGSVQLGETGEAPPVFGQAGGVPFVYVGNEPDNSESEALLVPKDSPITKISDLKGKKVAVPKGSNANYFLVKALESGGLKYSDIQPVYLPPSDGRTAFEGGSVDAWAVWEPYQTTTIKTSGARVLAGGKGLVKNWEFILARRDLAEKYPKLLAIVKDEIIKFDQWAAPQPRAVAEILSPALKIDVDTLEAIEKKQNRGFRDLDNEVITYQQNLADTFLKVGLIDKQIVVRDDVLAPAVASTPK